MINKRSHRNDIILICVIFMLAFFMLAYRRYSAKNGSFVNIYVNNELYQQVPLNHNDVINICDDSVIINAVGIENGYAFMKSANCPDGLCIRQQRIAGDGESICCLPNKVYVEVVSDNINEYDAYAQ